MSYPHQSWPPSPPPWPQDQNLEHRLTRVEVIQEQHESNHEEHFETTDDHRNRLNFHERLILIIVGVLSVLLQDKLPAALLSVLKGGGMP